MLFVNWYFIFTLKNSGLAKTWPTAICYGLQIYCSYQDLSIVPWWVLSSFIASLSFWLVSEKWEITEEVLRNCTAYAYYIMLMAKCTCAWLHHLLKLLLIALFPCTNSSQPGWFHVETYLRVLGLWFLNTAVAKIAIKQVQWKAGRSFHHVMIHLTNYTMHNFLCLNK